VSRPVVIVTVLLLAAAGCRSSERYPAEEKSAEKAVDQARDAGADEHSTESLAEARKALDEARAAEEAATKDELAARDEIGKSEAALRDANAKLDAKRAAEERARTKRDGSAVAVDRQEQRRADLQAKGMSDAELSQTVDADLAVARARLKSDDATLATLADGVTLREVEKNEIEEEKRLAEARLDTAEKRLQLARSLYGRAQDQAKLAEAESLDARRARAHAKEVAE
jgi:hypothetical protein